MGLRRASDRPGDPFLPSPSDPGTTNPHCLVCSSTFLSSEIFSASEIDTRGPALPLPWYLGSYCLLIFATLVQYFVTSGSSPGYVVDAMRDLCDANAVYSKTPIEDNLHGGLIVSVEGGHSTWGPNLPTSWAKVVLDLYPLGTSLRYKAFGHAFGFCMISLAIAGPLFDHHCLWIGTCIGQNNHCKFWWYICGEKALCIWTLILYIDYLDNVSKYWYNLPLVVKPFFRFNMHEREWEYELVEECNHHTAAGYLGDLLDFCAASIFHSYLIMTNQTTYEFVRRRRIPYLREIPERVHPFSRGMCRNIYNVCCGKYNLEPLPTA